MQESVHTQEGKEMTIRDIVLSLRKWFNYLLSKWLIIGICSIVGGIMGACVHYFSKTKYIAESNFVLEGDNSGQGLGAALGLGGEASAGLFSSVNNIIWLYNSQNMLKQVFLTEVQDNTGQKSLLIDQFKETSLEVRKRINKNPSLNKVHFTADNNNLNREQEIFIRMCINIIKKDYLEIKPIDKTENIVSVKVIAEDEQFAYSFSRTLIGIVNDFYIKTKTQKTQGQVDRLSSKMDSLRLQLGKIMENTALSIDNTPYPNPYLSVLRVESQRSNVDVQANMGQYLQVSQSLEAAKNELEKETPIIQIVDEPVLPLQKDRIKLNLALLLGISIGLILSAVWLIVRRLYKDIIKPVN